MYNTKFLRSVATHGMWIRLKIHTQVTLATTLTRMCFSSRVSQKTLLQTFSTACGYFA